MWRHWPAVFQNLQGCPLREIGFALSLLTRFSIYRLLPTDIIVSQDHTHKKVEPKIQSLKFPTGTVIENQTWGLRICILCTKPLQPGSFYRLISH